jgi:DNA-binding phage protein
MLAYLEACIEKAEGDVALIANALGDIVRAQCTSKAVKP